MAQPKYDFAQIELKWQEYWQEIGLFRAERSADKPKYYLLTMYPYPSGALHMGHVINYTIGDVLARYRIMKGFNVFSPMGWDSFGLPAENAAIRANIHPEDSTRDNIDGMRRQMLRAGWGYDWDREIATSHPGYYKWTQWLFLKLYEKGLAFKKLAPVNWCPNDNTVLANEQVINGACERCGTEVEQRDLEQWFFKMSAYAERLLENHEKLAGWPERVIKMQQEWIGRSEGARIDFTITETGEKLPVFTTRPDTVYGVTFMSLAPEHPLVEKLVRGTPQEDEVMAVVRRMRRQGTSERELVDLEKEGVETGFHVTNPVNGDEVPLYVANFALMTYGTGAVMAVPAHDQRDFEFARKYGLPVKVVIQYPDRELVPDEMAEAYVEDGVQVNSGPFDGLPNREAMGKIAAYLAENDCGAATVNYRLRDWLLSRQRYWGAPIPIIYCDACGALPVPEEDLPVELPRNVEFRPTGESPLAACEEFVNTACPKCGKPAKRETDTMDTFVDSSWYFLRYVSPRLEDRVFDRDDVEYWMPIDQYVGGIEHATMHLIYFRFFTMVLNDLGLLSFDEPATELFCQGMVCKEAHYCEKCKWLPEEDVENGACKSCGQPVRSEVAKMSKTKLNTVNPDETIERLGADTIRLYILSDTPPDRDQVWSEEGVMGAHRFLNRLWTTVHESLDAVRDAERFGGDGSQLDPASRELRRKTHRAIQSVTRSIEEEMHFNTAIASVFELLNQIRSSEKASPPVLREAIEAAIVLLAPIVPHVAEELWCALGNEPSVFRAGWPEVDGSALQVDEVKMGVLVDGKVRGHVVVPADADQASIEAAAFAQERVKKFTEGRDIKKVIVVPGRIVNIVCQ